LVSEAKMLFRQGRYAEAKARLDDVVKAVPDDSDAYQFRALASFAGTQYDAAAADVYDAFKLGNSWTRAALADAYGSQAPAYTGHLQQLEQAARAEAAMSRHFLLAYHYIVLEQFDEAERELNNVLQLEPDEELTKKLLEAIEARRSANETASGNGPGE
jgi:Tfp pilus assembly protein PilF